MGNTRSIGCCPFRGGDRAWPWWCRAARRDGLHKLTTRLVRTFVLEDLNVSGMLRNRRPARHIADAGWDELRRQIDYKTCNGTQSFRRLGVDARRTGAAGTRNR